MGLSAADLPWHGTAWERVRSWVTSSRLPHAVLIAGRPGLGKGVFAESLAKGLLCQAPAAGVRGCGQCRACTLVAAGSHPDLTRIEPEEEGKPIRVEQVRQLSAALALRPALGGRKVALLIPADAMNRNAANALLKTLEEPPGDAVLLLVSHAPGRLPLTVLSRCQRLGIEPPSPSAARDWLEAHLAGDPRPAADASRLLALAGGAPLAALGLAEAGELGRYARVEADIRGILSGEADPVEVASRWRDSGLARVCRWSYRLAGELLRAAYDPPSSAADVAGGGWALADPRARALFQVVDLAVEALRATDQGISLNEQLALDRVAGAWVAVARAHRA